MLSIALNTIEFFAEIEIQYRLQKCQDFLAPILTYSHPLQISEYIVY